jgi:hypothetical protein
MSDEHHLEAAARHMEATVPWTAMQQMRSMPLEQLLEDEEARDCTCQYCEVNLAKELKGLKAETFERVFLYLFADGEAAAWEMVARRVYAVAKAYFPHLLAVKDKEGKERRFSLEDLGHVFEEENVPASRARWQARVARIVDKPVRESGSTARRYGSKSATACGKYSEAQKGNQNRKGKGSGQGAVDSGQ